MKTILGTNIPDLNQFIISLNKVQVLGEKNTKEECVEILDENKDQGIETELLIISSALPGYPEDFNEYLNCLHSAFPTLKTLALLPPSPSKTFLRFLDGLGVYYLHGTFTPQMLTDVLECIKENQPYEQPESTQQTTASSEEQPEESAEDTTPSETAEITATKTNENEEVAGYEDEPLPEYEPLNKTETSETEPRIIVNPVSPKSEGKQSENQIIAVFAPSHSGATTLAANMALLATRRRKDVALIDLNLKKPDINTHYNITNHNNLDTVLPLIIGNELNPSTLISNMVQQEGVNILLGTQTPFYDPVQSPSEIEQVLKIAKETYPITIVDVNAQIDNYGTLVALTMADKVVVVLEQHVACLRYFNKIRTEIFSNPDHLVLDKNISFVLNRYRNKVSLNRNEVEAAIGNAKMECVLNETDEVYTSITTGKPLAVYASTKQGKDFINKYGNYTINLLDSMGVKVQDGKKPTLFKRFMNKIAM